MSIAGGKRSETPINSAGGTALPNTQSRMSGSLCSSNRANACCSGNDLAGNVLPDSAEVSDQVRAARAAPASAADRSALALTIDRQSSSPPGEFSSAHRRSGGPRRDLRNVCESRRGPPLLQQTDEARRNTGCYTSRSAMSFLTSPIALPGLRPFGQVLVQFMMVWQR